MMNDTEQVLSEAIARIREKKIAEAESLLKSILPEEEPSGEDGSFPIMSFNEPIEEIYYRLRFKPRKEIRKDSSFSGRIFLAYACVLMEKKEYEAALKVLARGIKHNPVDTALLFEEGEIFKIGRDWAVFKKINDLCLSYACRSSGIARAYRNYGYMFLELGDYDGAASCYLLSREYEDHAIAQKQLERLSGLIGTQIDEKYYRENFQKILGERRIQIGPSRDLLNIAYSFAEHCEKDGDYRAACYFFSIFFDLTRDNDIETKIHEMKKLIGATGH